MFIVSKQCNETYSTEHITSIYIGSDGCSIKVSAGAVTRGGILGKYGSFDETQTVFQMLVDGIAKNSPVYKMPSDEEVGEKSRRQRAINTTTPQAGKRKDTVGHEPEKH